MGRLYYECDHCKSTYDPEYGPCKCAGAKAFREGKKTLRKSPRFRDVEQAMRNFFAATNEEAAMRAIERLEGVIAVYRNSLVKAKP